MGDYIWIVVNAGDNSREKEVADEFNARACQQLTERRVSDQADILVEGPYRHALPLKERDRIAMLQGGGRNWKRLYGSGQLVATGRVRTKACQLEKQDLLQFREQYQLTRRYFPQGKHGNKLVGIIFYALKRTKDRLPREDVNVRPGRGDKFIRIGSSHPGYRRLDEWWNKNSLVT